MRFYTVRAIVGRHIWGLPYSKPAGGGPRMQAALPTSRLLMDPATGEPFHVDMVRWAGTTKRLRELLPPEVARLTQRH